MYPGTFGSAGLEAEFHPGLTVVLGANGLGKTTLVTLLFRMLTGPFDVSGLDDTRTLGSAKLEATRLKPADRRVFAARVVDNAIEARATIAFEIGGEAVSVTRSLNSQSVIALSHNGVELQASDERYQLLILELSGSPSFGEWILLLRYLVFYFEDRRALVWDSTAQRQVLRLLMLPSSAAKDWTKKERTVLELDSRVRNLSAALGREEREMKIAKTAKSDTKALLGQVGEVDDELERLVAELTKYSESLPAAESSRQDARLRVLTLEQERDTVYRDLERMQLERIRSAFPDHAETARYIIGRLISTGTCQTCGTNVPNFAAELEHRLNRDQCVICSSDLEHMRRRPRSVESKIRERSVLVAELDKALSAAKTTRTETETAFEEVLSLFQTIDASVSKLRAKRASLVSRLPASERELVDQTEQVSVLRGRLSSMKNQLSQLREEFEVQVRRDMETIIEYRNAVIDAFQEFASGFLLEHCQLQWMPSKDRVGQTGPTVDFPNFEFDMSGSDFPTPVRRNSPDQVSESQREFIDLAFRMALIRVAVAGGVGTLVVDAPESSLDAVFSSRAADVLAKFADPSARNRLILTSNLVEGDLVPNILRQTGIRAPDDPRIIDLLEIATPTIAVRQNAEAYQDVRDGLFGQSRPAG